MTGIVDVHAHYCPPSILGDLGAHGGTGLPTGVNDLDRREEWMGERGIEVQVLGPELTYADQRLPAREAARRARLMNDATAEHVRGRTAFAPLAMVALQSGRRSAAELEHAVADLGFHGAMIPSRTRGGLGDPRLDPLWQRAVDLDVPIVVHSGKPAPDRRLTDHGLEGQGGRPQEVALAVIALIYGGALDRFPALRLVVAMGGGNLSLLAPRLDRAYALRPDAGPASAPSTYLARLSYDTLVLGSGQLRLLLELAGAERVLRANAVAAFKLA